MHKYRRQMSRSGVGIVKEEKTSTRSNGIMKIVNNYRNLEWIEEIVKARDEKYITLDQIQHR